MVNANELRIGNKILQEQTTVSVITLEIGENGLYEIEAVGKDGVYIGDEKYFNPAPINAEALEMYGFEDKSRDRNGLALRKQPDQYNEFVFYINEGFIRYQTQGSGFTIALHHIKNLHQLQNVYHALTGVELTT